MRGKLRLLVVTALVLVTLVGPLGSRAQALECHERWTWFFFLEFPRGFWAAGPHSYQVEGRIGTFTQLFRVVHFASDPSAPLVRQQVVLIPGNLSSTAGPLRAINPGQDTVFRIQLVTSAVIPTSHETAVERAANTGARIRWDGGPFVNGTMTPVLPFCVWVNGNRFHHYGPVTLE